MRVLTSFDDRDPVPWANGAGETTELVSLADSENLTPLARPWRLSIARLDRTAEFSALPGMARTFLPTAEVVLSVDGRTHRIPRLTPLRFRGDRAVVLTELDEPCFAVNLMVAQSDSVDPPRRGLAMIGPDEEHAVRADDGAAFLLTLASSPDRPRFQLFELTGSDGPADRLGGVLLH